MRATKENHDFLTIAPKEMYVQANNKGMRDDRFGPRKREIHFIPVICICRLSVEVQLRPFLSCVCGVDKSIKMKKKNRTVLTFVCGAACKRNVTSSVRSFDRPSSLVLGVFSSSI